MCNFVYFFRFSPGHDDHWYVDKRIPREVSIAGVRRLTSWKTLHAEREPDPIMRPLNNYDRMTQVEFENLDALTAALSSADCPWSESQRIGLENLEGIVVGDEPEFDLLRDAPGPQYRFMNLPIEWSKGKPPDVPERTSTAMAKFIYFFGYRDDVDHHHADEWYLGHHTREGKQLPGVRKYVTWIKAPVSSIAELLPEASTFERYTELCFDSIDTWIKVCYEEGPKWVRSPRYGEALWGNYKCFFIPDRPDIEVAAPNERRE